MPNLPDIPGKDLVAGTTRRARAIAGAAGSGALAVGGHVVGKVLGRDRDDGPAAGGLDAARTDAGPAAGGPPTVPAGAGRRTATRPGPAARPKAAKPAKAKAGKPKAPAGKPKAPKPKGPADKPKAPKPKAPAGKPKAAKAKAGRPPKVDPEEPVATGTDAPTVPGSEPGDQRGGRDPHHALNNPVADADVTEYPDPYDKREDPRDPADPDGAPFGEEPHPQTGAESTSEPPPGQDPEVGDRARPPRRENLDD